MIDILQGLGFYALSIAILGSIGNCVVAYVSIISQKSSSSFVLFRYLAFSDMLALYFWNLSHFIDSSFNLDLQNYNIYLCKFGTWIQYSSLQSSAWILVLMSVDRYFVYKLKDWKKVYFTQGIAVVSGLCLSIFIYLVNSNVLFTYGYEFVANGTEIVQCFATIPSTYWMNVWSYVHSCLYSFIPFTILSILNTLLIVDLQRSLQTRNHDNSRNRNNKKKQTTTVIIMTLMFIVFTSPSAICSQFYGVLVSTYNGNIILFVSDCFAFSYHAFTLIILSLSSHQFKKKIKIAFGFKNETNNISRALSW